MKREENTDREDSVAKQNRPSRGLAAAMILRAFLDYHAAKKLIKRKGMTRKLVKSLQLSMLTDYETEIFFNGKHAWEWMTRPPLDVPSNGRLTFAECLEILDWTSRDIRELFSPDGFDSYVSATGRQIRGYEGAA